MTYTVEPHGAGWALYKGRTNDRHGYRLCNLTDGDQAIYAAIVDALNRAAEAAEAVRVKPITMAVSADPRVSQSAAIMTPTTPECHYHYWFETGGQIYTIPGGFIPWNGGDCPVAEGTVVEVIYRSGGRSPPVPACVHVKGGLQAVRWTHHWKDGGFFAKDDIIGYRIHKPADFRLEAGKFYVTASGERVGPMVEKDRRYGSGFSVDGTRLWDHYGKLVTGTDSLDHLSDLIALSSNQDNSHD